MTEMMFTFYKKQNNINLKNGTLKLHGILFCILFLGGVFFNNTYAQVTIGTDEAPADGALLQLKNISNVSLGAANSNKGLGLPRVMLTSSSDLYPMFINDLEYQNNTGGKKTNEDNSHIGLVVYNETEDICQRLAKGVYVWDGEEWRSTSNKDLESGIYSPNSYMIESDGTTQSATTVSIPVEKAYSIWQYYGNSQIDRLPNNVDLSGPLSASIYWQENTQPVGQPTIAGSGKNAIINVPVTGIYGNATISLSIGGVIRWSWHIWVTPAMETVAFNNKVWMDRNLGATSTTVNDINRYGLYYQQGRKDPFPRSAARNSDTEPVLWAGGIVNGINNGQTVADAKVNFSLSITSPNTFIWTVDGDNYFDWYSTIGTDHKQIWTDRWDLDECGSVVKTSFDPCPKGWRVPSSDAGVSPWNGLTIGNWNQAAGGWGVYWNTPDAGYYPGSGTRGGSGNSKGKIEYNATHVYMWSASNHPTDKAQAVAMVANYPGNYLEVNVNAGRANGFAVRCIKFEE